MPINRDPQDRPRTEEDWRRTRQLRITDSPYSRTSNDVSLVHPLLQHNQDISIQRAAESHPGREDNHLDWVRSIENIIGAGSANILGEILSRVAVTSRVSGAEGNSLRLLEVNASRRFPMPGPGAMRQEINRMFGRSQTPSAPRQSDPISLIERFVPLASGLRWANEANILYGSDDVQRALNAAHVLQNALVPKSLEAEKKREESETRLREKVLADREAKKKERQEAAAARKLAQKSDSSENQASSSRPKIDAAPKETTPNPTSISGKKVLYEILGLPSRITTTRSTTTVFN